MAEAVVFSVRRSLLRLHRFLTESPEFDVSLERKQTKDIQLLRFYAEVAPLIANAEEELREVPELLKAADKVASAGDERMRQQISEMTEVAFNLDDTLAKFFVKLPSRRTEEIVTTENDVPERLRAIMDITDAKQFEKFQTGKGTVRSRLATLKTSSKGRREKELFLVYLHKSGSSIISTKEKQIREWRQLYSRVESHVDVVVGFEKNINEMVAQLTTEGDDIHRVFCICGMGGIGKTTLAKQIYYQSEIRSHFDSFAWVCLSEDQTYGDTEFNLGKQILIQLLTSDGAETENLERMDAYHSGVKLSLELESKKCLVILDNVWSHDTLELFIKNEFPKYESNCKILITTRNKSVADKLRVHTNVSVHEPRFLDENQSWKLFQMKATFGRDAIKDSEDYNEMEELGQKMLKHCAGLPLAITVLGELLSKRDSLEEWKEMLHKINPKTYIKEAKRNDQGDLKYSDILWVLSLSYNDLPLSLRPCLLYLAHFSKDAEIKVKELCRIWMAEGIISTKIDAVEVDMYECFNALVKKCMIQVEKFDLYGRIKTFRIHNLTRDLCMMKSKEKRFLAIVNSRKEMKDQYYLSPDSLADATPTYETHAFASSAKTIYQTHEVASYEKPTSKTHGVSSFVKPTSGTRGVSSFVKRTSKTRGVALYVMPTYKSTHGVAIYVNRDVAEEFSPLIKDDGKARLRSLMCFSRLPYPSYEKVIQPLLKRFHKLRVLKFENITHGYVGNLPEEIGELVQLRFLSLKGSHVEQVPSSICNLILLQTLDLRTNWKSEFPNVLWKLEHLRHLYFPHRCHISGNRLKFGDLGRLETLVNIPLRYCELSASEIALMCGVKKFKVYFHAKLWKDFNLRSSDNNSQSSFESLALENLSRTGIDLIPFISSCSGIAKLHLEGKIVELTEDWFSGHLIKLTLKRTHLQNDPMMTLQKLPNLKILVLNHNAFEGKEISCSNGGFPRLESLSLIALEQLKEWRVEEGALSSLSNLLIEDCYQLGTIPDGLRYVTTLKKLLIKRMPREFIMKVKESGKDFDKVQHVPTVELVN